MDTYLIATVNLLGGYMSPEINYAKGKALCILMEEAFSYIEDMKYNEHVIIAKNNALVRKVSAEFFMYKGGVYPTKDRNGTSIKTVAVIAPPLHFSLMQEFDDLEQLNEKADKTVIKNFFIEVLSKSCNGIVLKEFLPSVLITRLKGALANGDYHAIDFGTLEGKPIEDVEITKMHIAHIQKHYGEVVTILRNLLMERFLLQE
jgi:hypothetical protein